MFTYGILIFFIRIFAKLDFCLMNNADEHRFLKYFAIDRSFGDLEHGHTLQFGMHWNRRASGHLFRTIWKPVKSFLGMKLRRLDQI